MAKPYDFVNEIQSTLNAQFVHGTDTTLTLVSAAGFPTGGGYIRVGAYAADHWALYEYTAVSTNDLTGLAACTLGEVESEAAYTFPVGTVVEIANAAEMVKDVRGEAIHKAVAGEISAITEKTAPVAADMLMGENSEPANAKMMVQLKNLPFKKTISGFVLKYNNDSTVKAGVPEDPTTGVSWALVNGEIVTATGDVTSGATSSPAENEFWYAYLYNNSGAAAVELSKTAPQWSTTNHCWRSGTDETRRLIGYILTTTTPTSTWAATHVYDISVTEQVQPTTSNGYYYNCTVAGTSGSTEPTWPTTPGDTVVDNTVTWTCHQIGKIAWFASIDDGDKRGILYTENRVHLIDGLTPLDGATASVFTEVTLSAYISSAIAVEAYFAPKIAYLASGDDGAVSLSPDSHGGRASRGLFSVRAIQDSQLVFFGRAWLPLSSAGTIFYALAQNAGSPTARLEIYGCKFRV